MSISGLPLINRIYGVDNRRLLPGMSWHITQDAGSRLTSSLISLLQNRCALAFKSQPPDVHGGVNIALALISGKTLLVPGASEH